MSQRSLSLHGLPLRVHWQGTRRRAIHLQAVCQRCVRVLTDQTMVRGVPTRISFASFTMSPLRIRTQPCEMRPGISPGRVVPWTPTSPPPGQSVSVSEVALVMNASGP